MYTKEGRGYDKVLSICMLRKGWGCDRELYTKEGMGYAKVL